MYFAAVNNYDLIKFFSFYETMKCIFHDFKREQQQFIHRLHVEIEERV